VHQKSFNIGPTVVFDERVFERVADERGNGLTQPELKRQLGAVVVVAVTLESNLTAIRSRVTGAVEVTHRYHRGADEVEDVPLETGREPHPIVLEFAIRVVDQEAIIVIRDGVVEEIDEDFGSGSEPQNLGTREPSVNRTLPPVEVEGILGLTGRGSGLQKQRKIRRERALGAEDAQTRQGRPDRESAGVVQHRDRRAFARSVAQTGVRLDQQRAAVGGGAGFIQPGFGPNQRERRVSGRRESRRRSLNRGWGLLAAARVGTMQIAVSNQTVWCGQGFMSDRPSC